MRPIQTDRRLADGGVINILKAYQSATARERFDGARWYSMARAQARELHPEGAAIIAALSPRKDWETNLKAAGELVHKGKTNLVVGANKIKAKRIIDGESPDDVLKGPKVRAFWKAIEGQQHSAVVDRHAYGVYVAGKATRDRLRVLERQGVYDHIAHAYKRAAHILGVNVTALQCTTWIVWKRSVKA